MALFTEQIAADVTSPPATNGRVAKLRLDPPIASSDWILVRGSVELPSLPKSRFGWLLGKKTLPDSQRRDVALTVTLADGQEARPITLGPAGEFETRFASCMPRVRPTYQPITFTLRFRDQLLVQTTSLFVARGEATVGVIVLAHQEPTMVRADHGHADSLRLSETSRELAWLASSGDAGSETQPVFYLGLPASVSGVHRESGWPQGLALPVRSLHTAHESAERARWIARLIDLFAGELDFVIIGDSSHQTVQTLQSLERHKVAADRIRGIFLSDTRPVARGVLRQSETPAGIERLSLPVQVCTTLDAAREATMRCGLVASAPTQNVGRVRRLAARARVTRYPIVFCHGMVGYSVIRMERHDLSDYFHGLRELMTERGFHVLMPELGRTHSIEGRADQLRRAIGRWTSEPVNIVGHSMGGLDARFMISQLDMADRVVSLTTVASPHRGTYFADWFVERFDQGLPLLRGLERLGVEVDGFRDVTRVACRRFNETVLDSPKVRYYSYSAFQVPRKIPPILRRSHSLIARIEGANDGLVSEASARWGEHLNTLRADHIALVGERSGEYFDHLALYTRIADDLIRSGF